MEIQKFKATAFMTPCHQNTELQQKGQKPQRKYRWKTGKDSAWKLRAGALAVTGRFVHYSQQCQVW